MIETSRYILISKDPSFDFSALVPLLELCLSDKFHIDSGRTDILESVARQIHAHKEKGKDAYASKEVETWAGVLTRFFRVVNHRDKSKVVSAESVVTELNKTLARLFPCG